MHTLINDGVFSYHTFSREDTLLEHAASRLATPVIYLDRGLRSGFLHICTLCVELRLQKQARHQLSMN